MKTPTINEQRRQNPDVVYTKEMALNDANNLFAKRVIEFETGRHGIVLGYDRNYDHVVIVELTEHGGMHLVLADTADLDEVPNNCIRIDCKETLKVGPAEILDPENCDFSEGGELED